MSVIVNEIHRLGLGPSLGKVIYRNINLNNAHRQVVLICIWQSFGSNWTVVVKLNCDVGFDLVTW